MQSMAIPVVEFSKEGYKIRNWLKINCSQMKSLNFVNWCNAWGGTLAKNETIYPKNVVAQIAIDFT